MPPPTPAVPRKGARRMSEIPPAVLRDLNAGRIETVSLVEWLAIDDAALLAAALESAGAGDPAGPLRALKAVAGQGVMTRTTTIGRALFAALGGSKRGR